MATVIYRAADGSEFETEEQAAKYESSIEDVKALETKINEYIKHRTDLEDRGVSRKVSEYRDFCMFLVVGWTPDMQRMVDRKTELKAALAEKMKDNVEQVLDKVEVPVEQAEVSVEQENGKDKKKLNKA
jgi:hypothetical protein